jgi:hypothetical protein
VTETPTWPSATQGRPTMTNSPLRHGPADRLTVRLYSTGNDAEGHTNQPGYARTV